jgi:2'-5' RNA ligase
MAALRRELVGAGQLAGQAPLTSTAIRAFFGLPLPEPQRRDLGRYLEGCTAIAPDFRWALPDNLHITVRFIGNVERSLVEGIADRLEDSTGPAFQVALGDVGQFRRSRLARVVWLGIREGADALQALAGRVETECRNAGLEPETRPFQPHLTLARARARDGASLPELPAVPRLEPWTADELVLYSSHLGKGGAIHEPIRTVRLSRAR